MKPIVVFLLVILITASVIVPAAAQEPVRAVVEQGRLNVRSMPYGEIIGQLNTGESVTLLGREDTREYYFWFYVRSETSGLEGWVDGRFLPIISGHNHLYLETQLPVLIHDSRTLDVPVYPQGIVIGHRYCYLLYPGYPVNVRAEPDRSAMLLGTLPCDALVAVYGRNEAADWYFVRDIATGLRGWVWRSRLSLPVLYRINDLPVLAPVANPDLSQSFDLEPATSLTGTVNREIYFRYLPAGRDNWDFVIPANTPVTLVGRNANSRYFKSSLDGHEGWLYFQDVDVEGDPNRLPILSTRGSPDDWAR